jgi:hypothetical protein
MFRQRIEEKEAVWKNLLMIVLLGTVGLFAESKAEFFFAIGPVESTVKVGAPVDVEAKTTNLTNHDLMIGLAGTVDAYDVRRDGVLVAETELAKKLRQPPPPCKAGHICVETVNYVPTLEPLTAHDTRTETVRVSDYREMREAGKYTIQLQEGTIKSNIVTVIAEP